MAQMTRDESVTASVTADTTGGGTSTAINMQGKAGGHIVMPSGLGGNATLSFYSASGESGTYQEIYTTANASTAITLTAAKNYPLPDEVYGCQWLKLIVDSAAITATICLVS